MSLASHVSLPASVDAEVGDPRKEIRYGVAAAALFFVGFLGWAAVAPLDAAAFASGSVTVSGGPQAVQTREGGVIQSLHVRDGDRVNKGDVLVDLSSADVRQSVNSLRARAVARKAEIARLDAERAGQDTVKPWLGFDLLTGEEKAEAERALALEDIQLQSRRAAAVTERAVLSQRVAQGQQQMIGTQRELAALKTQDAILGKQLDTMRSLADKGYAPRIRVNDLEQSAAGLQGSMGARQADVARLSNAVGEAQLQIREQGLARDRQRADEMRAAQDDLRALEPQLAAARELLRRAEIKSPVSGRVFALQANTVGGVARPGDTIMRIVPDKQDLVVEGKLLARDAADVHSGQPARVKLTSLHDRRVPTLEGVISKMSADSLIDERTGVQYYEIEVRVNKDQLEMLKRIRGVDQALKPGLGAEVMVTLHKRTALQYALEPLFQAFTRSGHEG